MPLLSWAHFAIAVATCIFTRKDFNLTSKYFWNSTPALVLASAQVFRPSTRISNILLVFADRSVLTCCSSKNLVFNSRSLFSSFTAPHNQFTNIELTRFTLIGRLTLQETPRATAASTELRHFSVLVTRRVHRSRSSALLLLLHSTMQSSASKTFACTRISCSLALRALQSIAHRGCTIIRWI